MHIDINSILIGNSISVNFDMDVNFREEDIKNTSMIDLKDCHVRGKVTKVEDVYTISFDLRGTMILNDAVTLELIPYKFKIVDENDYEIGDKLKINENLLDIYEILWENVVLEVPLRIVKDTNEKVVEGDGWSLNKQTINNSGLEGLKKLLEEEEK